MRKKAFITGISGQDGSYLSEHLLEQDYDVCGIIRRHSVAENQDSRLIKIENKIKTEYGDILDISSLQRVLELYKPDLIFHLAAQSHVRISFDMPLFTMQVNALGTANLMEAYRHICPYARLYNAASSEMFGNSVELDGYQRETTPMHPVSPYGCAKLFSYSLVRNYRKAYKLFASNGILMNHESPRRGINFVTNKIVKTAVEISKGLVKDLHLGNLDSYRDWGHSSDYTLAMIKILQHDAPDDFVIATGESHSVRELCSYVFEKLNMDYKDYVIQDEKFMRPEELSYLCGDSTKARTILDWKPKYTFTTMLDEMIKYWIVKML